MPETTDQPTDPSTETPAGAAAETDWVAEARKWEKRAKEHQARVKDLEPRAQQFDALEAASKTELQQAQEQLTALQRQAEASQREALVSSVALAKGLPANLAARLQGADREELEADADELLSTFSAGSASRPPAPDLSQGSSARRSSGSPEQDFASFLKGQMGS